MSPELEVSVGAFGPREDLAYFLFFGGEGIEETLYFVSGQWQMGVDFHIEVHQQRGDHQNQPPEFRVFRDNLTWGEWHPLKHPQGHPIRGQGRGMQWRAGGSAGETRATLSTSTFEQHPERPG